MTFWLVAIMAALVWVAVVTVIGICYEKEKNMDRWTEDQFWDYLCRTGATRQQLEEYMTVEACDCDEDFCHGWQTRARLEVIR